MKKFTQTDVLSAMNTLIHQNGQTSTLEIKQFLRNKGFWAIQSDIKNELDKIEQTYSSMFDISNNGIYRSFSLKNSSGITINSSTQQNQTLKSASTGLPLPKVTKANQIDTLPQKVTGAWKAYSKKYNIIAYYDSSYTRDQVRCAFRLKLKNNWPNVKIQELLATKIK